MSLDLTVPPGSTRTPAPGAADRINELHRFLRAVDGYLPDQRLAAARTVADRAGERLSLSRQHTVVALAGSTGTGKSSLFNALARLELSQVGVRRPTTGLTHACAWGTQQAVPLLNWLGVPPGRRFARESALDADDEQALRGLVLLDLPDFDSVQKTHRIEAERLLSMADLVVWVTDPQKYADDLLHRRYLTRFGQHRAVTVLVLNQADLLGQADAGRCVADLRRLLTADGLNDVPVLATSTVGRPGLGELRTLLERTVSARAAQLQRLAADLDVVVAELTPLVAVEPDGHSVDTDAVEALTDALATAAGVPGTAAAVAQAYRQRAVNDLAWPLGRRRGRPGSEPAAADRADGDPQTEGPTNIADAGRKGPASTAGPRSPGIAAIGLAVRALGDQVGLGLPAPWPAAVLAAARSRLDTLPEALDEAIAGALPEPGRASAGRRTTGALGWLAVLAGLGGLSWLAVRLVGGGALVAPAALLGGAAAVAVALVVLPRPLLRRAARDARTSTERRLRVAVGTVADQLVVAPVEAALTGYAEGRSALHAAR